MRNILKNSFKLNLYVLRVLGLYPTEKHSYAHKCFAYIMHTVAVLPLFVLGTLNFFLNGAVEREKFNDFATVGVILLAPKMFFFLLNRDSIEKCLKYFDKAFAMAASNDTQRAIIEDCHKSCRRNSTLFFNSVSVALLGFYVNWYFQDYHKNLPLNVWLPFNSTTHPVLYCGAYFTLVFALTYATLGCATIDPFVAGLLCHASGQLNILKDNSRNLDFYVDEEIANISCRPISRALVIFRKIRTNVCHYRKIIHLVNECENCFSTIVLCQFMESIFVIGLCILQLIKIQEFNAYSLLTVINLVSLLFQVFFYCYYGTTVFEENNSVCTAIYMSNWYEYDNASRRAILILMERSKRPMLLSAAKVLDLSLETFTKILKSSYSLIAVLKNY